MKVKTVYLILLIVLLISFCVVMVSAFSNIMAHTSADAVENDGPTVVIDAGHGGEDGGAQVQDVLEKDINLSISGKLADLLRLCGCSVIEIRESDISVYDEGAESLREKKVSDLQNRVKTANSSEQNILVSIHQNKFDNSAYSGTQVFYSVNHDGSAVLAQAIRGSVISLLQKDNTRECKPAGSDIYLLDQAQVPAVIVECGFLSNDTEREKLLDPGYQSDMAYAVAMGVLEYINKE